MSKFNEIYVLLFIVAIVLFLGGVPLSMNDHAVHAQAGGIMVMLSVPYMLWFALYILYMKLK